MHRRVAVAGMAWLRTVASVIAGCSSAGCMSDLLAVASRGYCLASRHLRSSRPELDLCVTVCGVSVWSTYIFFSFRYKICFIVCFVWLRVWAALRLSLLCVCVCVLPAIALLLRCVCVCVKS